MQTIWKYKIPFEDAFKLEMPIDAEIMLVQVDEKTNHPCLWVVLNPENKLQERYFELFGTGNPISTDKGIDRKYIGSFQYQKGEFIGHVFERIAKLEPFFCHDECVRNAAEDYSQHNCTHQCEKCKQL